MKREKSRLVWVILSVLVSIAAFFVYYRMTNEETERKSFVKVGFMLDGDESTPYSANFIRAIKVLEQEYGESINLITKSNVPYDEAADVLRDLCKQRCDIIFSNSFGYGETVKEVAAEYPDVQFCEATCDNANTEPVLDNYHTFMGEIYQGRYVAGMIAGLKLQEMIYNGMIRSKEAWIGYVGAYPYAEVISGYTAFFLGARQTCPTVRMKVKYSNTWSGYAKEKELAEELIEEGCVIISQHSDTIGPAAACENLSLNRPVYHVGYNQDMMNVAPTTSLIGTRIDWTPYICGAVEAVFDMKKIEESVPGHVHGNDIGAGFEEGWVKMLELNQAIAPPGSESLIQKTIEDLESGQIHVFEGNYIGVNPDNPEDTWDLNKEYRENENLSAPSFYYVLQDVIIVE